MGGLARPHRPRTPRLTPVWIDRLEDAPAGPDAPVVWTIPPGSPPTALEPCEADLAHAARRRDPARRAATLARRLALRALAARVLGVEPARVEVEQPPESGPAIVAPRPLHAAIAARDGWALVGVSPVPLGLDIEAVEPGHPPLDLLHPEMARRLGDAGPAAFAEAWCGIEASLKLWGVGLDGLAEVVVEGDRAVWPAGGRPAARLCFRRRGDRVMAAALSPGSAAPG